MIIKFIIPSSFFIQVKKEPFRYKERNFKKQKNIGLHYNKTKEVEIYKYYISIKYRRKY